MPIPAGGGLPDVDAVQQDAWAELVTNRSNVAGLIALPHFLPRLHSRRLKLSAGSEHWDLVASRCPLDWYGSSRCMNSELRDRG